MNDITDQLRSRACPAGEPWTGDNPEEDHGHTDCWLMHQAVSEIERLRDLITAWADADDDLEDVDGVYHSAWLALRKAVGR